MSDYLAVGAVSAVLCSLLSTALPDGGPNLVLGSSTAGITATSPDLIATGAHEQPQINLFMYHVNINPALRNLDLPSASPGGARLSNPPLALNLHYLVSAYGSGQFDPEVLLAWAMKVFHDTPVVSSQAIQQALTALPSSQHGPAAQLITGSTLASQIEHLRITPETLTTEEIYRLWTAFQTTYRPSTALQVSVVVIQDTHAFASNKPVAHRTVTASPLQSPVIDNISPVMAAAGQVLTITGTNFVGDSAADTVVSFDGGPGLSPDTVQARAIRITLPATLPAGTRTLRVQRRVVFPAPSVGPHPGFSSSPAPFQLIPTITDASPLAASLGSPLTVTVSPAVASSQQAVLYVGDNAIPIDERPVGAAPSTTLTFPIPAALPTGPSTGTFPLRVEVDGAQSKLTMSGGQLTPQVQVS